MKEKETQNNEDEKVSIWDYVEVIPLLLFIMLVAVCILIVICYFMGLLPPPFQPPRMPDDIPHMHP